MNGWRMRQCKGCRLPASQDLAASAINVSTILFFNRMAANYMRYREIPDMFAVFKDTQNFSQPVKPNVR